MTNIQIGQHIYYKGDMANSPCPGIVTRVGEARRNIYSLAGGMRRIESPEVDIVLNDGRAFDSYFITGGSGERIEIREGSSPDRVPAMLAKAEARRAIQKAEIAAEKTAREAAIEKARAEGLAMGLRPEDEHFRLYREKKVRGSAVAHNLRIELKAAGIKVRRLRGDHDSIRLSVDAGDLERASEIVSKYESGHFDGMQDCYIYTFGAWRSVFGSVRFAFVEAAR